MSAQSTPEQILESHRQAIADDMFDPDSMDGLLTPVHTPETLEQDDEFDYLFNDPDEEQHQGHEPGGDTPTSQVNSIDAVPPINAPPNTTGTKRKHEDDDTTDLPHSANTNTTQAAPLPPPPSPQHQALPPPSAPAPPPMSNAPPSYAPIKTRPRTRPRAPAAKKQPRNPPPPLPSPTPSNDALPDSDPAKLWCVCRQPARGRMIACDAPGCRVEWFHFGCVGLRGGRGRGRGKVKGEWVCGLHRGERGEGGGKGSGGKGVKRRKGGE
ncbi:hypothetical protein C7974DRAFT_440944 [Boeremia exigua]|uniref:uncharacterized protein n=1 Tax=Boeremia exigua TaxID=749465 RepID=UPI001E8EAEBA|nr:uncharacterized protein C7974DRAFT_440944 [Boeremia exigua]KAH6618614.1 hypothetical protein C7974DRAFT_440944 [Boeremia exigua]